MCLPRQVHPARVRQPEPAGTLQREGGLGPADRQPLPRQAALPVQPQALLQQDPQVCPDDRPR